MPAYCPSISRSLLVGLLVACAACSRGGDASDSAIGVDADLADLIAQPDPAEAAVAAAPDTGPDPTLIDPCALVTQEEAEAIVKLRLDTPQSFNLGSVRPSCVYPGFPAGPVAKVDVAIGEGAQTLVATDRRLNERDPDAFTAIDDLGDEGWLRRSTVYFRRGENWIVVGAVRLIDETLLHEPLVAAARSADARLLAGEAEHRP